MPAFHDITTYRLTYPKCCGLADPSVAEALLRAAERVDRLGGYTAAMWDMLTDVVLQEWFGLRLPPSRLPWDGPIYLPPGVRFVYCLDRSAARQARDGIDSRYLSRGLPSDRMSIFAGYGLAIPDDLRREREGLEFLARQAEHFRSVRDYLFVVQTL